MLLYFLGFLAAIASAFLLHKVLKIKGRSFFVIEMPNYKLPLLRNVIYTVVEKTKSFVLGAGKIILAISIVLWFLGSNGISYDFKNADKIVKERIEIEGFSENSTSYIHDELQEYRNLNQKGKDFKLSGLNSVPHQDSLLLKTQAVKAAAMGQEIASYRLEHSYIGYLGKGFEPMVKPLGYDWKIGIAILTSFAAREVFVGTLATIYSVGNDEEETIKGRMAAEVHPDTKKPLFNLASGISLILFYAFAMQCMSTLAVVKKETNSWRWPLLQLGAMTIFAYLVALLTYQILK
jgi:ferrous iron transport protein B